MPLTRSWLLRLGGLGLALLFLAGAVGYVVGQPRPPGEGSVDVGFLQDMSTHHSQAVAMASLVRPRTDDGQVLQAAEEILVLQSTEVGMMAATLRRWGRPEGDDDGRAMGWMGAEVESSSMPGLATEADLADLRAAEGDGAGRLFLELMIDHHRGGVAMAEEAAERADDDLVRGMAERMASGQRYEIDEMGALLAARGGTFDPTAEAVHGGH